MYGSLFFTGLAAYHTAIESTPTKGGLFSSRTINKVR
jgi:hypothetical protein